MDHITFPLEIKMAGDDTRSFSGYASVFGNIDSHGDIVAKGAFKNSLEESKSANDWPSMLLQHGGPTTEDQMPIGVWTHMEENETGLRVEGKLAKTKRGNDVYELLKMQPRPALSGLSIGFRANKYDLHKSGAVKRTLTKLDLVEVSLVVNPSNRKATITRVKSRAEDAELEAAQLKRWKLREEEILKSANSTGRR
jgi:HK97 family phage prohead protease